MCRLICLYEMRSLAIGHSRGRSLSPTDSMRGHLRSRQSQRNQRLVAAVLGGQVDFRHGCFNCSLAPKGVVSWTQRLC